MTSDAQEERPSSLIGAVDNVLRLLAMFETKKVIRVNELSRDMGLSRSTVHRMLSTLHHHHFVEQDDLSRAYAPGPALVDIGLSVIRNMDVRTVSHGVLVELAEKTNETVHLGVLRGDNLVYLDSVESAQMVRTGSRVGWTLPAHTTASGKALLAAMSDGELQTLYPDEQLPAQTGNTITTRAALFAQLDEIRHCGYATNMTESEGDVSAVGAAVCDPNGRVRGALAVTAPASRVDDMWITTCSDAVVSAARVLGNRFS